MQSLLPNAARPRSFDGHARRAVAAIEGEALGLLSALVRNAPDGRLEQLMRTPFRKLIIGGILSRLPRQLEDKLPEGVSATLLWRITAPGTGFVETYSVVIAPPGSRLIRGDGAPDPHITVSADAAEMLRLLTGNSNPMRSYFTGKLKLTGDIMLASRLLGEMLPTGGF